MQTALTEDVFANLKVFVEGEDVKIGQDLGAGSQGFVKLSELIPSGELVAVKQYELSEYYKDRIESEISHLRAAAGHESIVQLLGLYAKSANSRTQKGLVLEYCEGGSLDQIIEDKHPLNVELNWITKITDAVRHLHNHGIIHRDLKPANILFPSADRKTIKLCDFAECTTLPEESTVVEHTSRRGTRGFRASEIEDGQDYSNSADVFSLGRTILCILLETNPDDLVTVVLFQGLRFRAQIDGPKALRKFDISMAQREQVTVSYKGEKIQIPKFNGFTDFDEHAGSFLQFFIPEVSELTTLAKRMYSGKVDERPTMTEVCKSVHRIIAEYYTKDSEGAAVRKQKNVVPPLVEELLQSNKWLRKELEERDATIAKMQEEIDRLKAA